MKTFDKFLKEKNISVVGAGKYSDKKPDIAHVDTIKHSKDEVYTGKAIDHHIGIATHHKEAHEFFKNAGQNDRADFELGEHEYHNNVVRFLGKE